MWKNVLVLVSLCLLFEDVNAQTTKNRYYKANDENVSYVGRTEIQSDGSVSFDWTGTYLRTRLSGGELSMKISDTGINYYNVFVDSLLHKTVKVSGKDTLINFISGMDKGIHHVLIQKRTEGEWGRQPFINLCFIMKEN